MVKRIFRYLMLGLYELMVMTVSLVVIVLLTVALGYPAAAWFHDKDATALLLYIPVIALLALFIGWVSSKE